MNKEEIKFGTDGWRGVMCDTFILRNVRLVAQAIAKYLLDNNKQKKGVVIGYDSRFFSDEFAVACADVMVENRVPVYLAKRPLPTPITAYAIKVFGTSGAIMITASHNPAEYNGIKFIAEYAGPATPEVTSQIEKNIQSAITNQLPAPSQNKPSKKSLCKTIYPLEEYVEQLKRVVKFETVKKAKLKVVADPMFGAGFAILPSILEKAGCETEAIHNFRDPLFGDSMPDPIEANLSELKQKVLAQKADLGVAIDGDGDRLAVIDSKGAYLSPNQILTLLAVHLLKNRRFKGSVVRTVATTHALDVVANSFGVKLIEVAVGFKYVGQEMLKGKVLLGGEESGGVSVLGHIPEKDGILANLLLAEMLAYEKRPLSEVLEDIYRQYGRFLSLRLDIKYPSDKKEELFNSLKSKPPRKLAGLDILEVADIDGLKFILEDGSWLLIRASGTEPLIRAYIESKTEKKFARLKKATQKLLS